MILRVRLPNGGMERILIPPGSENELSLQDALQQLPECEELNDDNRKDNLLVNLSNRSPKEETLDVSQTISSLGLKHGSLLTLVTRQTAEKDQQSAGLQKKPKEESIFLSSSNKKSNNHWDPFPDLAKDYQSALLQTKKRRTSGTLSFGDLAHVQSSLHVVEPQSEGTIKRIYMCQKSAERFFQAASSSPSSSGPPPQCGICFGTVQKERVETKKAARTSLSTSTAPEFRQVTKVHTIWQTPMSQKELITEWKKHNMNDNNNNVESSSLSDVFRVAYWLGLQPVGWIFAYKESSRHDNDGLPVFGRDLHTAACLQIETMKTLGREAGSRFCTLAMDATTGATEAFQCSDVYVQMVAEGVLQVNYNDDSANRRQVETKHGIIVDGTEVKQFDSVLCLVNTALLSHEGTFAGTGKSLPIRKNGSLTTKARKALLALLAESSGEDDHALMEHLCDFYLLLALDRLLERSVSEQLCHTVKRWSRGLKQSTALDKKVKVAMLLTLEMIQ